MMDAMRLVAAGAAIALMAGFPAGGARAWSEAPSTASTSVAAAHSSARAAAIAKGGAGGSSAAWGGAGGTGIGGAGGLGGAGGTANVTVSGSGGGGAGGGAGGGGPLVSGASAPAIFGANPCTGSGLSAGVSTSILGLSFGTGNTFDDVCRLVSVGKPAAAFELLCRDADVRQAALDAGTPCAADRIAAGRPVHSVGFVDDTRPDWCDSASPGELRKYAAVCGSALPRPIRKPGQ